MSCGLWRCNSVIHYFEHGISAFLIFLYFEKILFDNISKAVNRSYVMLQCINDSTLPKPKYHIPILWNLMNEKLSIRRNESDFIKTYFSFLRLRSIRATTFLTATNWMRHAANVVVDRLVPTRRTDSENNNNHFKWNKRSRVWSENFETKNLRRARACNAHTNNTQSIGNYHIPQKPKATGLSADSYD